MKKSITNFCSIFNFQPYFTHTTHSWIVGNLRAHNKPNLQRTTPQPLYPFRLVEEPIGEEPIARFWSSFAADSAFSGKMYTARIAHHAKKVVHPFHFSPFSRFCLVFLGRALNRFDLNLELAWERVLLLIFLLLHHHVEFDMWYDALSAWDLTFGCWNYVLLSAEFSLKSCFTFCRIVVA